LRQWSETPVRQEVDTEATAVEVIHIEEEIDEPTSELTAGQLATLMSRLNPNPELTDAELDAKYPLVESMTYPQGTLVNMHLSDPHIKIVWVLPKKEHES